MIIDAEETFHEIKILLTIFCISLRKANENESSKALTKTLIFVTHILTDAADTFGAKVLNHCSAIKLLIIQHDLIIV